MNSNDGADLGNTTFLSLVAQMVNNLPAMWKTQIQSLGLKDSLEKKLATYSSILAWRIPRTENPGGLQSLGLQRIGFDRVTNTHTHIHSHILSSRACYSECGLQTSSLSLTWGLAGNAESWASRQTSSIGQNQHFNQLSTHEHVKAWEVLLWRTLTLKRKARLCPQNC